MREARKAKKLTQQGLADTFDVSQTYVAAWENGVRPVPADIRPRLARKLGIPEYELYSGKLRARWDHLMELKSFIEAAFAMAEDESNGLEPVDREKFRKLGHAGLRAMDHLMAEFE